MKFPLSRILPPFGALTADDKAEFWTSAPVPVPLFGGAHVAVRFFVFENHVAIPEDMIEAGRAFLGLGQQMRAEIAPHLWALRRAARTGPPIEPGEAFAHISLRSIDVTRRDADDIAYVTALCESTWAQKELVQIVFQRGVRLARVSAFDGEFTDGDAAGDARLDGWMADPGAHLPVRRRGV